MNRIPEAQDTARIIRPTFEETLAALEEHFRKPLIGWSYQPVRRLSRRLFSGDLTEAAIDEIFRTPAGVKPNSAKAQGRRMNRQVARLVREHAEGRVFQCYPLQPRRVDLSAQHHLTINPGFYFVEGGVVKIFWLQPRKDFGLSLEQMGILNGLLGLSHFRDDFEDADLELLELSADDKGNRVVEVFDRAKLPAISEEQMKDGLEKFLRAYLILREADLRPKHEPKDKDDRPEAPGDQQDLFK